MEQVMGIKPTLIAWKANVLSLNYTCKPGAGRGTWTPTRLLSQDLKSWASTNSATPAIIRDRYWKIFPSLKFNKIKSMVTHRGFEPRTLWLKVKCSTTELVGLIWLGWVGSNHRVPESKSGALPLGYSPKNGGQGGIRTPETFRCLIYSQKRLTTSLPTHWKL